ncbi:MAG: acyl-ACP--UDP-N-acetylglucosamine O-acyltransferase [Saprospiraceae bacterium]
MTYPKANVHPGAVIGENVVISPYVTIEDDVVIGDGTNIGPNAVIMAGTRMGKHCKVFPGAVIGAEPQDLKFAGEQSTLTIGDHTTIREFCTINRGTAAAGTTTIGSHCLLMAYVHVAHDCIVGDHVVLANNVNLAGHVEVGDHAVLGGTAAVHQFVKIGAHAMLGGGSLLRKDVPPYITAAREPVRFVGVNKTGLERRDFSSEKIASISRAYRILFAPGFSRQEAMELIERDLPDLEERREIIDFVTASNRGIIRGPRQYANGED